jgi:hypothetical protein
MIRIKGIGEVHYTIVHLPWGVTCTIKIQRNLIFRMHYELAESKDSGDLIILKMTINEEGSLSAMGLFPVDKSTICTIISTVVTYLLILVQHKD